MNEKQLVSFGNYLLRKCKVKGHDLDGEAIYQREVTDADICNWKENIKDEEINLLPSRFQINDLVSIRFKPYLVIDTARIIKVHFTEFKVLYDLEVRIPWQSEDGKTGGNSYTRIYNVDSAIVEEV